METLILIIEFLGTFAAAISGTRLAAAKRFDWFGGYVVGLATAIGGGT
ncbi:MAG: TRIC cation channel family protein, partial [Prevotella sp.]|nr:TRIC cation channel family protein [Prevotella sp.]